MPRAAVGQVQVQSIFLRDLKIQPVKPVFLITFGMNHLDFRWIQESPALQSVYGDEVPPFLSPIGKIEANVRGAKTSVGTVYSPRRFGHAEPGFRGYFDHQARFVAKLRWRCAGDHLQRLNRIGWNLSGEDLALLVSDRLPVHRK